MNNIVKIEGTWFWGKSIHLISDDGKALIKIVIDNRDKESCDLYDLNVHPSCQRQGIAFRLMQEAFATAKENGIKRVFLWVERGSWMENWYRRLGFEEEEFRRPPDDTTFWMIKFL